MFWKIGLALIAGSSLIAMEPLERQEKLEAIDRMMAKAAETFAIPGMAVAIVMDGEVASVKGYGLRNQELGLPVTENTLFAIGSCSKAFTTFALGQLVDNRLIGWDDPVIEYLPEFRLQDLHATHHLTIRDLVTHRCGLPGHDLVWYNAKCSREDLLSRLQHLEPTADLREKFQYNNLMYAMAGLLIERVTGQTWEEYVQEHIFDAIGMSGVNFSVEHSQQTEDFALPYTEKKGQVEARAFRNLCTIGPAGSINASAADMAKWVQLQLCSGQYGDKQLIQPETLREMHRVQTPLSDLMWGSLEDPTYYFGYGLGWAIGLHHGRYLVAHGGGIDGFLSEVALFPKENIGVVVLTNTDSHVLPFHAAAAIADCLLEEVDESWLAEVETKEKKFKELQKKDETIAEAPFIHPVDRYVGVFEHPGYGAIEISLQEGKLIATLNDIPYFLQHQGFDHFTGAREPGVAGVSSFFLANAAGDISEFQVSLEPELSPIVFKRKASNELLALDYLKKFAGVFECSLFTVEISLKKDRLFLIVPGQPPYELKSEKANCFSLKKMSDYALTFTLGKEGALSELQLSQGGQTFVLREKSE